MTKEAMKLALEALESCGEDGWYTEDDFGMSQTYDEEKVQKAITALREALAEQPAQQEPVAWMQDSIELYVQDRPSEYYTVPLYTSPPAQRTWVGLLWGNLPEDGQNHDFLRGAVWAEAKLKELNQ
jgi:hypothetical protein